MSKINKTAIGHEPTIGEYIDDEERKLIEAIEGNAHKSIKGLLTPERARELQEMAKNSIKNKKKLISIRLPVEDLELLKLKAKREGMPYQTLINSILHKAVSK